MKAFSAGTRVARPCREVLSSIRQAVQTKDTARQRVSRPFHLRELTAVSSARQHVDPPSGGWWLCSVGPASEDRRGCQAHSRARASPLPRPPWLHLQHASTRGGSKDTGRN